MSDLSNLLKQKAELEAQIEMLKKAQVGVLKLQLIELVTHLRELNSLPSVLVELFTDKAGTFNPYRVLKIKKPK